MLSTATRDTLDVGGKVQQARITAYIPHEMKEYLEQIAESEGRTVSNLVAIVLRRWVDNQKADQKEGD